MKRQEWYSIEIDERELKKERAKARDLKQSQWWKNIQGKGICHYCNEKFPGKEITMDHVVPIARGGKSTKGNVVPSCKKCNAEKKLTTPAEQIISEMTEIPAYNDEEHSNEE